MKSLTLARQLTIFIGLLVLVVAMLVLLIGYSVLRHELDQQAHTRLIDAERYVTTALALEQARAENTVRLVSQRPTLIRLFQNRDEDELSSYLISSLSATSLDFLLITERDTGFTVGTRPPEDTLAISVVMPLEGGGQVIGGLALDENVENSLEQQTGLRCRFTPSAQTVSQEIFRGDISGTRYYWSTIPLDHLTADSPASVTLYLPLSGIAAGQYQSILPLAAISLGIAGITALAGGLFVRSRVRPVWQLASQAKRIGQGDLQTPIVVTARSQEVDTLSQVLDTTRIRFQQIIEELIEARKWAESLIQSIIEGIVTWDVNGKIIFFSQGAAQITGWSAADAIGQPVNHVFRLANEAGDFSDFIPSEGNRRTVAVLRQDGTTVDISITHAHPVRDHLTTIAIHDVTEDINRRSVQAYFLANMSHEFKTPLAGMKASLELLLENLRYLSTAETEELLRSIFLSASTLQNLIENLLESGKIEANHFALSREEVEIEEAAAEAIRLVQPLINRRQQIINVELPLVIPALYIDRSRIVQVMVNLLNNASKYSPMESAIDVVIQYQKGTLHISILDCGPGIPDEKRDYVFRRFARLGTATKSDHGSGLGLAVVKAIVEAHGGQVGVEPRPNRGSSFWFSLPDTSREIHHLQVRHEG